MAIMVPVTSPIKIGQGLTRSIRNPAKDPLPKTPKARLVTNRILKTPKISPRRSTPQHRQPTQSNRSTRIENSKRSSARRTPPARITRISSKAPTRSKVPAIRATNRSPTRNLAARGTTAAKAAKAGSRRTTRAITRTRAAQAVSRRAAARSPSREVKTPARVHPASRNAASRMQTIRAIRSRRRRAIPAAQTTVLRSRKPTKIPPSRRATTLPEASRRRTQPAAAASPNLPTARRAKVPVATRKPIRTTRPASRDSQIHRPAAASRIRQTANPEHRPTRTSRPTMEFRRVPNRSKSASQERRASRLAATQRPQSPSPAVSRPRAIRPAAETPSRTHRPRSPAAKALVITNWQRTPQDPNRQSRPAAAVPIAKAPPPKRWKTSPRTTAVIPAVADQARNRSRTRRSPATEEIPAGAETSPSRAKETRTVLAAACSPRASPAVIRADRVIMGRPSKTPAVTAIPAPQEGSSAPGSQPGNRNPG